MKSPANKATKKKTPLPDKKNSIRKIFSLEKYKPGDTLSFAIGLITAFVAIFLAISFVSYLSSGREDQSMLESIYSYSPSQQPDTQQTKNAMGYLGAKAANYFMQHFYGLASFCIPVLLLFLAMKMMKVYKVNLWRCFINLTFIMIWMSIGLATFVPDILRKYLIFPPGGDHGEYIRIYLSTMLGDTGLYLLLIVTALCYLIYLSRRTIQIIRKSLHGEYFKKLKPQGNAATEEEEEQNETDSIVQPETETETEPETQPIVLDLPIVPLSKDNKIKEEPETKNSALDPTFEVTEGKEEKLSKNSPEETASVYDPTAELSAYKYPSLDLLKKYKTESNIDMEEQNNNKERITTILHDFGIDITSVRATVGPTITLYEITPAPGVKISKIRNLEDDIALRLSAKGVRIIAPIPGQGTIGIEVPNNKPQIVSVESILSSRKFQESVYELPVALGKTITNDIFMADLAKMPHLLVAGATGMGKSVGLNILLTSLLYKKHPSELKLVLIDPKKVEFSIYAPLDKFFIAKVDDSSDNIIITDVNRVKKTLNSLCKEMDDRYLLLKQARVRNIKEYNKKFCQHQLNPEKGHRFLPYIVVVIDEFGDLIMVAGKEIELPIARIAQLARAVGIHMVIATQRPTTNIITGTIKANFPSRIAFRVLSSVDSRTILDRPGANQLIGNGDMLFLSGGNASERVQCAYIDTSEVEAINNFISEQPLFPEPYLLPEVAEESSEGGNGDMSNGNLDSMFEEVARYVVASQSGSTSLIQRKFSIGYNRAGRLMDQLECAGIVGSAQGSKPRDVLVQDEIQLENILNHFK